MDIRNFFGTKSQPRKVDSMNDDTNRKADDVCRKKKAQAQPSAASIPRTNKRTKIVIHESDDSDATDCMNDMNVRKLSKTKKQKESNQDSKIHTKVEVSKSPDTSTHLKKHGSTPEEPSRISPRKKSRSMIKNNGSPIKVISRHDRPSPTKSQIAASHEEDLVGAKDCDVHNGIATATSPSSSRVRKKSPIKETPSKSGAQGGRKLMILEPTLELDSFYTSMAEPECFAGLTFVFSGVLKNLSRNASTDYVKELGGRVTSAVSGKTSYLVVGDTLEDGRHYTEGSKYKKATEIGVKVVHDERHLFGLGKLYSDEKVKATIGTSMVDCQEDRSNGDSQLSTTQEVDPPITATQIVNPYAKTKNPYAKSSPTPVTAPLNPYSSSKMSNSVPHKHKDKASSLNALWADKYAPTSTADILGNQDSVKKLKAWLGKWETTFNSDKAYGKSFSSPNGPWKAALLSGPPGIGKTTTATLVAKEDQRDVLEMNASDARSKKTLSVVLGDVTGSQVLDFGSQGSARGKKGSLPKTRCLIMDEVDGMGAGDRGGMAELINIIKNSRIPIICICNDRQSQKIKSLLPYCLDLRYKRPVKTVIARRAIRIGEMEGMKIEQNAIEAIAESCGNDIRQVLNCLQMWSSNKSGGKSMTYRDLKERESSINKDAILRVSMFDATRVIIEGRKGLSGADRKAAKDSLYKRSDAFFVDYSLIGLNVHQNYLKVMVGGYQEAVRSKDDDKMDNFVARMHDATLAMSDFAVGEQTVRGGDMNWSLLPFLSMMAVKTGYHAGGDNGGFLGGFPEFAAWMGKNSTRGKKNRLLHELQYHMNYKISSDKADLRLLYLPVLRSRFMELLGNGEKSKINEAIALMDEYGLDRDDLFENLDEFKIDSEAKGFNDIDSKQKAAFTREYNQGSHKSQALVHEQGASKVTKASRSVPISDLGALDAVDDDAVLEESDDGEEEEISEEKLKLLFGKKTKRNSSTSDGSRGKSKTSKRKSK